MSPKALLYTNHLFNWFISKTSRMNSPPNGMLLHSLVEALGISGSFPESNRIKLKRPQHLGPANLLLENSSSRNNCKEEKSSVLAAVQGIITCSEGQLGAQRPASGNGMASRHLSAQGTFSLPPKSTIIKK